MAVLAEGLSLAAVDAQQCAKAVMFDLVNPAASGRRLGRQYRTGTWGAMNAGMGELRRIGASLGGRNGRVESAVWMGRTKRRGPWLGWLGCEPRHPS